MHEDSSIITKLLACLIFGRGMKMVMYICTRTIIKMTIQTCYWQYIFIYILANFSEANMVGIRNRYDLMMNYLIKMNWNVVGVLVKTTNCLQQRNEWLAARYKMIICLLSLTFWKKINSFQQHDLERYWYLIVRYEMSFSPQLVYL